MKLKLSTKNKYTPIKEYIPYNVLDIARYVINYSDKTSGISNLKLQKVLYLIQAYFLIKTGKPCFEEEIQAWPFGPVIPEAYHEYKQYGSGDIPTIESYIFVDEKNFWNSKRVVFHDDVISDEDKVLINKVVDKFSDYSATDLTNLTMHQTPWEKSYHKNHCGIISKNDIKEYFTTS